MDLNFWPDLGRLENAAALGARHGVRVLDSWTTRGSGPGRWLSKPARTPQRGVADVAAARCSGRSQAKSEPGETTNADRWNRRLQVKRKGARRDIRSQAGAGGRVAEGRDLARDLLRRRGIRARAGARLRLELDPSGARRHGPRARLVRDELRRRGPRHHRA